MIYRAKSNVRFGSVSLSNYNAFALWTNIFEQASRDVTSVSIPGRNGDLLFDNGRYRNCERQYVIYVTMDSTLPESATNNGIYFANRLIAALQRQTGYQRLEDDYDADVYMMAYLSKSPDVVSWRGDDVTLTVTFTRKPQKFLKSGETRVSYSNGDALVNQTNFIALPLVRVYGTGSGTVSIGSETIQVSNISSYIDIDCESQNAYKGTQNQNSKINLVSGDFFALMPNSNGISFTGDITKVDITARWWTL